MSKSIMETERWLRLNTVRSEFVIFTTMKTNAALLIDKFRTRTSTDCSELSKLSEKTAKVSGRLPNGGSLIAVNDFMLGAI